MTIDGTTSRLLLRPLELADAEQIQVIFPHWEIVRYLKNVVPWPYPADGARIFCEEVALPQAERGESWHWTLRLKSTPEQMIGVINLRKSEQNNRGFWMGLDWQGQGLMSEACVWANDHWFSRLGVSGSSGVESGGESRAAPHHRKAGDEARGYRNEGLRLRPSIVRKVGDYSGGMAGMESADRLIAHNRFRLLGLFIARQGRRREDAKPIDATIG